MAAQDDLGGGAAVTGDGLDFPDDVTASLKDGAFLDTPDEACPSKGVEVW
eukprot:CAMPEP_0183316640 /NCGR_PEP_ID=MMETSP0160_2-20130417/55586_1 /TAXON_ID=2839 ORGANISM="Odontella Sinensis, Strain Grunow 1884" /NCGR_SAMPLE_ID=MMETSP0160_2 /ASSEMBLY_ACC=CAM_ASM_000250 /LENGTH=49 /DNA_ID=CAMNT_0025482491 /DNA_START=249 /DNA_END=395 /DNA_ORIENTATION=+